MADHVDIGRRILVQDGGDIIKDRQEGAGDVGAPRREGQVGREVEDDIVARTGDVDTTRFQFSAQILVLAVHIGADASTGQGADTRADDGVLAAVVLVGQGAQYGTGTGADQGSGLGIAAGLDAIAGIDGLTAGQQESHAGQGQDHITPGKMNSTHRLNSSDEFKPDIPLCTKLRTAP